MSAPSTSTAPPAEKKPVVIITIGMAGSGKTTFVQRMNSYLHALDPPKPPTPFDANIDIRDTVNYKEVMKQYNLGPNGGILTALNLFTTKFDQVLGLVEKRAETLDHVILDTPGQIEIFTWSASGAIITDAVASTFPTVLAYIIDTPRTVAPATFMSNMLYACSILYKTKLPFILVFNKTDAQPHGFALEWMQDFEAFQAALASHGGFARLRGLMNSMSLVLDEFYKHLKAVGVSSLTGAGMKEFFDATYLPELERVRATKEARLAAAKADSMQRMMADLAVDRKNNPAAFANDQWDEDADNGDEDNDDDGNAEDNDIIDRNEERGPGAGEYIDLTQMRPGRGDDDLNIRWKRPG
ncbi:hypothetical protein DFH11DRAFT_1603443 [Phellopilus nigrolimitatus]|nr:hypothetical protein DFH11DRAFT_1603443 [Phellopilus nigrolimitatus]